MHSTLADWAAYASNYYIPGLQNMTDDGFNNVNVSSDNAECNG